MSRPPSRAATAAERDGLRARVLDIAARLIEQEGLAAVTARRLAGEAGCAVGSLYNLFENTDAIVLTLNLETLDGLAHALAASPPPDGAAPAEAVLHVARRYLDYTVAHRARWAAVLEFVPHAPHGFGPALGEAVARAAAPLEAALGPLGGRGGEPAAVLWAGLEGIVRMTSADHAGRLTRADAETLIRSLIRHYLAGLASAPP